MAASVFEMRSVRAKLLLLVAVCLVPTLTTTLYFSAMIDGAYRQNSRERLQAAEGAFAAELSDDIAALTMAAQILATDPDVASELGAGAAALLAPHIDDYALVNPALRVLLADPLGRVVAANAPKLTGVQLPLPAPALLTGFRGLLPLELGDAPQGQGRSYAVAQPVYLNARRVGLALASFPLDADYLRNTKAKIGLDLALQEGGQFLAQTSPDPALHAPPASGGEIDLRQLADRRTVAVGVFAPRDIAPLQVMAMLDLTAVAQSLQTTHRQRLFTLLAVAAVALAVALALSRGMADAAAALARVLPGVALHRYQRVEGIHTGDEFEDLAQVYNQMVARIADGERWRAALGKYLSPAAQEAVRRGEVHLGGSTMPATVLFSDIRGFTSLAETLPPERVLELLNRYFTEMVAAIAAHGGTVDKFIGDCVMAVWGPPRPGPDDAVAAVRAGLEMRTRLAALNLAFAQEGLPPLRTGIGIHSGEVVAGNIGAEGADGASGRMEYTVIGDTVNLASRLEALCKELHAEFVIGESTVAQVEARAPGQLHLRRLAQVAVRGRTQAVQVYEVVGLHPMSGEKTAAPA